jgi:hypothetical protein
VTVVYPVPVHSFPLQSQLDYIPPGSDRPQQFCQEGTTHLFQNPVVKLHPEQPGQHRFDHLILLS